MRIAASPSLLLRSGPSVESLKLIAVPYGETVFLQEYVGQVEMHSGLTGQWARVQYADKSGYVFGPFLQDSDKWDGAYYVQEECLLFPDQKFPDNFSGGCLAEDPAYCVADDFCSGYRLVFLRDKTFSENHGCTYDRKGSWKILQGKLLASGTMTSDYYCDNTCYQGSSNIDECLQKCHAESLRKFGRTSVTFDFNIHILLTGSSSVRSFPEITKSSGAVHPYHATKEFRFECMRVYRQDRS